MVDSSLTRRRLYLHPAHRTIGVSGVASSFRRWEGMSGDEAPVEPMRVLLVSRENDGRSRAAMASFERILLGEDDVRCNQVDCTEVGLEMLGDSDCVVAYDGGLQIVGRWADLEAEPLAEDDWEGSLPPLLPRGCEKMGTGSEPTRANPVETASGEVPVPIFSHLEVEVAAAARCHPVVAGVGPFVSRRVISRQGRMQSAHLPENAACLLVEKTSDGDFPVAWVRQVAWAGRGQVKVGCGRVFHTVLGCAEDFREPEFIRLVLNALDWVGR